MKKLEERRKQATEKAKSSRARRVSHGAHDWFVFA